MAQQSSGEFASADPTTRAQDARFQERGIRAKILSVHAAAHNTFNVQRHLASARTHRAFRASALQTWREVALLQRCWRVGILREFGAKGFRFSCWERIMPFKILWGGG